MFKLTLATDGSLTLFNTTTGGRRWVQQGWAGAHLDLRTGGKLVLVAKDGSIRWANNVAATCSTVWVHDSGFVVSSHGTRRRLERAGEHHQADGARHDRPGAGPDAHADPHADADADAHRADRSRA